jgi:hypothetical protein
MYFYQWICVHQQIPMFVYVQVSLLVYACVSINLCLIVIKTVFDYHSPSLRDIVLEVLIILSLISIYDLPSQKHYFIISFYSHFVNHFLWHNFYTWLHLFICPCFLVLTFVCNWFGLLFAHYTTSFTALNGRKKCWPLNFLFRDDADVVAYLNMDNHNTRKIWHYLSYFIRNFIYWKMIF